MGYTASYFIPFLEPFRGMMALAAIGGGAITIFCSAMIYIVTKRPFWQSSLTFSKFGTTIVLAGLAAWNLEVALNGQSPSIVSLLLIVAATMARLALEYQVLSQATLPTTDPIARSARLLLGPLKAWHLARTGLWIAGGIILPVILLGLSSPASIAIAGLALTCVAAAELIDRGLYFAAESTPAMPNLPK